MAWVLRLISHRWARRSCTLNISITKYCSSKWDGSPRDYWWFHLSSLAMGLWTWEDMLKALTLLCYLASCFKTDSSAQALVIVQRFKAQQNNSFMLSRGRKGVKQNHHPETVQTKQTKHKMKKLTRGRILVWSKASCNTSPAQPQWCNPQS